MSAPVVHELRIAGYLVDFPDQPYPTWFPTIEKVRQRLLADAYALHDFPALPGSPAASPPLGVGGWAAASLPNHQEAAAT